MGCKIHTPHFILLSQHNTDGLHRLGMTVSKKVGNAVERNWVKRMVREYFRLNYSSFSYPVDLSVIAKKGAANLKTEQLTVELDRALICSGGASNG